MKSFLSVIALITPLQVYSEIPKYIIDLTSTSISIQNKINIQICSGFMNEDVRTGEAVYTLQDEPYDSDWLKDTEDIDTINLTDIDTLLTKCLEINNMIKGYILYDYKLQQVLVPNLITLASVTNALLLESNDPLISKLPLLFDAITEWKDFNAVDATSYMYDNYINSTSTLGWMNPGYDQHQDPRNPPITHDLNPKLIDYIVKAKIFNLYMNNACIEGTDDYNLLLKITTNNPWPRPIPVYGYNDAYPIAGDIFEAETSCNDAHNMGQIASDNVNNLAFFSRKQPITTPVIQNTYRMDTYDPSRTYVMFSMGDGDNLSLLKGPRRTWMQQRVSNCLSGDSSTTTSTTKSTTTNTSNSNSLSCFPLTWTISPHALHLAPDWIEWFYEQSYQTKHDYFMLPPTGDLYSYPSEMPQDVLTNYIKNTEYDSYLLNTSSTTEWEWFGHWKHAETYYFPQYETNQIVKGIFTVNVPYNLPIPTVFEPGKSHKKITEHVIAFKPREWRGTTFPGVPFSRHNYLTPSEQATVLNNLPKGSLTWIYVTSDGGANLQMLYDLIPYLDEHVIVTDPESLISLAFQAEKL